MIQGSDEWVKARLGKLTASRIHDAVARTKSGWGASRANYMAELIAERLTGVQAASFVTPAMQWGLDTEAEARAAYAFRCDADVEEVGFVPHRALRMSGASPDGIIGDDGMVEIKCPGTSKHIDALIGSAIERRYVLQMQWQMACTDRKWCDFVSYDPRLPEEMRLHVQRVERDYALLEGLEIDVFNFLSEIDQSIERLLDRFPTMKLAA